MLVLKDLRLVCWSSLHSLVDGNLLDKYINKEQKLKFRNLKENLIFGSFRPIILVVRGEEESRDKGRERETPSSGVDRGIFKLY